MCLLVIITLNMLRSDFRAKTDFKKRGGRKRLIVALFLRNMSSISCRWIRVVDGSHSSHSPFPEALPTRHVLTEVVNLRLIIKRTLLLGELRGRSQDRGGVNITSRTHACTLAHTYTHKKYIFFVRRCLGAHGQGIKVTPFI